VGSSYWPRTGTFMSASGQFFMSADSRSLEESRDDPLLAGYDTPVLTSRPDSYTTFVDATFTASFEITLRTS